jgi:hypothetical protein
MQYQIVDGVLARSVGESLVLFHPETERLLTLNACGTRIWELLLEGRNVAQIVVQLTEEFAGPAALIQGQMLEFLAQLESEQIIRREG